ncbi:unnamed protein product, partial [Ectocarpus sp. 8 AP-2014]
KEQADAPKKTGEGTVDPEEPSEEAMKSSLEHHTALAVQYDLYAKEQGMSKGKVGKEHAEWAGSTRNSNTEDLFSLRGGRGGGGRGGGGRGGRGGGGRGAGGRDAGGRGAGARGAGGRGGGGRVAGGRGAGGRGAGGASGRGRGGTSSTGGRPDGSGSRGASNHWRPGPGEDWETAEYFAPRRGALDAAGAGELTVDLLPEEGGWEEEVKDLAAADDEEAQMLSGGKLGRQYRDGANGSARKQVFRGNPEVANASVHEQLAAGFDYLFRRDEREEERRQEEREERAARLAAGGSGGDAGSARLDRMEAKVEDQKGKLDKLLELVG